MNSDTPLIDGLDWPGIAAQLDVEGYAMLPGLFNTEAARALGMHARDGAAPGRVSLAAESLGQGGLFYFADVLPEPLARWRQVFYRHLAPIANRWNDLSNVSERYPGDIDAFAQRAGLAGGSRALSHLTVLREHDYVALHQRADGEAVFPLQLVALLSEPGVDFTGGEFVMTEQRPRMQSRPLVLPLRLGDAALIATSVRPFKGAQGYYRVNLKHAVSRVRSGQRVGLELLFHNGE